MSKKSSANTGHGLFPGTDDSNAEGQQSPFTTSSEPASDNYRSPRT